MLRGEKEGNSSEKPMIHLMGNIGKEGKRTVGGSSSKYIAPWGEEREDEQ